MSDVVLTTAITGATAVLSGLLGYGTARGQLVLEKRRLAHEFKQAGVKEREGRRDLYLEYLAVIDDSWKVTRRSDRCNHKEIEKWWDAYNEVDNRVVLLGGSDVHQATYLLWTVLAHLRKSLTALETDELFDAADDLWEKISEAYNDARSELVQAMREDVNGAE